MNFITDTDPSQTFSIVTTINGSAQDIQRCNLDLIPLVEHLLDGFREETSLRHFVDVQDRFFVAIENSTGLAVALLVLTKETVKFLYVHKSYRRKGLATKLYKEAIEYGEKQPYFEFMYNPMVKEAGKFLKSIGALETFTQDSAEGVSGGKVLVHARRVYLKPGDYQAPKPKPWQQRTLQKNVDLFPIKKDTASKIQQSFKQLVGMAAEETQTPIALDDCEVYVAAHLATDEVFGFVAVERTFSGKNIKMVYVRDDQRRKGIGSVLVEEVIRFGVFQDYTFVAVSKSDKVVQEFFERLSFAVPADPGWKIKGEDKFYVTTGMELNRVRQVEEDRKIIADSKSYVYWDGPQDVTLDGNYDLKELKALVRFIENGGPDKGRMKHEDLK